jgi:hypothetical protein
MRAALEKYLATSGGLPPAELGQLTPLFDPPLDPAILQRYEVTAPDKSDSTAGFIVAEKLPVRAGDKRIFINAHEYSDDEELLEKAISRAGEAIAAARGGTIPASIRSEEFLPYLSPSDRVGFLQLIERKKEEALRKTARPSP